MPDRVVLIQYVTQQRTELPKGQRIWTDGLLQKVGRDNTLPGPTDPLERDRDLKWQDERQLTAEQVEAIKTAIGNSKFFELEPRLLINYCKEDPGTMIWAVNLDGQTWRVVVYDPRPRRSPDLDNLSKTLTEILDEKNPNLT